MYNIPFALKPSPMDMSISAMQKYLINSARKLKTAELPINELLRHIDETINNHGTRGSSGNSRVMIITAIISVLPKEKFLVVADNIIKNYSDDPHVVATLLASPYCEGATTRAALKSISSRKFFWLRVKAQIQKDDFAELTPRECYISVKHLLRHCFKHPSQEANIDLPNQKWLKSIFAPFILAVNSTISLQDIRSLWEDLALYYQCRPYYAKRRKERAAIPPKENI